MEDDEQLSLTMMARLDDLLILAQKYATRNAGLSPPWFTDAVAAVAAEVMRANDCGDMVDWLTRLAAAMWQAGYEAVPSLQWVLPEGVAG